MTTSREDCDSASSPPAAPIDPTIAGLSQRFFTSVRADVYRSVRLVEKDVLKMPWGPRIDVLFDPKGATGIVGGSIRIMARAAGTEVQIANAPILDATTPIALGAAAGCDEYVVRARLGSDPGNVRRVESYFFARVSNAR